MSGSLTPEHLEELIAGYVLGDLCSEEAEEFIKLLTENPEVIQEVNRLQEVLGLIPYALPEVVPPQHLRSAIVEAVQAPVKNSLTRKSAPVWSKIVGSVAAIFALTLGLDNYRLRQDLNNTKDVITVMRQPETHLFSVKGKDKVATASGSILMDFEKDKAVIALQNLPTPPADQAYWLWAVIDNGKTIRCGQFNSGSGGKVLDKISTPSGAYDHGTEISRLLITLESSQTPRQPSAQIVMVSTS